MPKILYDKIMLPYLNTEREIVICLPNDYENSDEAYPVLYMHDGQNLITASGGLCVNSWGMKETLEKLELNGKKIILVGINNGEDKRFDEYSPFVNTMGKLHGLDVGTKGGLGHQYADFIVNDLKKHIDKTYRTKSDYSNTYLCGSSMGGLITACICARYPDVFSKAGVFSIASWFAEEDFLEYVKQSTVNMNTKYYVLVGTEESSDPSNLTMPQLYIDCSLNYVRLLLELGVNVDNIKLEIGAGFGHNEAFWAEYMEDFIEM